MPLTIFYDATCPLCAAEMDMLRQYDERAALRLENIHATDFSDRFPQIDVAAANQILHGLTDDGDMLYGLDVTVAAWRSVGRKKWLAVLRWPVIRWFADRAYLVFARNRYRISGLLTGANYCGAPQADSGNAVQAAKHTQKNCVRNVDEDTEF